MADQYPVVKDIFDGLENYKCASNLAVNQGDMIRWDEDNLTVAVMTAAGQRFLGVSLDSQPFRGLTELTSTEIRVQGRGIVKFKTTNAETYTHGKALAMGADAQTVTNVVAGKTIIGEVWAPLGTTITGAAGTFVNVNIFGAGTEGAGAKFSAQAVVPAYATAGSDKEEAVFVAPYDLTVVKATITPQANVTFGAGSSQYLLQLRNKGTAGSGTAVLCTLGTTATYAAFTETNMGTITNADVDAGEVIALFDDQLTSGLAAPEMLVRIEYVPRN